jgi:predicted DNA-binding transcriptional regulator YafY
MKGYGLKKTEKGARAAAKARQEPELRPEPSERSGAGYSRPPLARMLRIHQSLMENRYPNCRKMAEEFEVAAKTVQRDVNFMRDQMRLPIEYDKARFGFHYTRPVTALPSMGLTSAKRSGATGRRPLPPPIGEKPALGSGRGGFPVRIGFDIDAARAVRERTWHPSQVIHTLPGGAVEMTLRARDEMAIAHWVLSWGARAWVIEPQRLRTLVKNLAREILARHRV